MVKVQKSNPKFLKKDDPGIIKKTQMKKTSSNSSKADLKKIGKNLENGARNKVQTIANLVEKKSKKVDIIEQNSAGQNLNGKPKKVGKQAKKADDVRKNVTDIDLNSKPRQVEKKAKKSDDVKQNDTDLDLNSQLKPLGKKMKKSDDMKQDGSDLHLNSKTKPLEKKAKKSKDVKQNDTDLDLNSQLKPLGKKIKKSDDMKQNGSDLHLNSKTKPLKKKVKKSNDVQSNSTDLDINSTLRPVEKKVKKADQNKKQMVAEIQNDKPIEKKNLIVTTKEKKKINKTSLPKGPLAPKVVNKIKKSDASAKTIRTKQTKDNDDENKKIENTTKPIYEPTTFDEEKFKEIVCVENIRKVSEALKVLVEKEVSKKKTQIFTDYRYFLDVTSYKIAHCPKRMVKLNLKHSLVDPKTDDVVLIVRDLQRGAKVDYEPTVQHYQDLLREIGKEYIKVVPFNQLRNEYSSYEAKNKFAKTYDYFLCDGSIVSHVVGFCGKSFQKPRTTIYPVILNNPSKYKNNIESALKRTSYRQLQKGNMTSIPVGNHLYETNQLVENVEYVIEQLKSLYPGGYPNIRNMYIKIDIKGTSSLPLYVNLSGAPAEVPNVIGPREQRMIKLKKQANEILSKFSMTKTGEFVKLNKAQAKRKLEIREAREGLLSSEPSKPDENNIEFNPPSKKKIKRVKKVEPEIRTDDEEDEDDDIVSNDVSDEE